MNKDLTRLEEIFSKEELSGNYHQMVKNRHLDIEEYIQRKLEIRKKRQEAAKQLFDAFVADCTSDDESVQKRRLVQKHLAYLTPESLPEFVEYVIAHRRSAMQSLNAHKRHRETNAFKAEIFAWLDTNFSQFATRAEVGRAMTKQVPVFEVTLLRWLDEWKKRNKDVTYASKMTTLPGKKTIPGQD